MKLTLGFSPCPNDTFIFDALVNKKIDTGNFEFDVVLEDVQTLNQWAIEGKLDVTKLSYGVLPLLLNQYSVLNSGSALGRGVGPLLITSPLRHLKGEPDTLNYTNQITKELIAIPGKDTTAHLLFSLKYPNAANKVFLRYDAIENFVLEGKGAGVIIHENRFTYQDKGLIKITDLGDYWETTTRNPIPLGGIVIKKNIDAAVQLSVDALIKKSIEFAFSNYPELTDYIRIHSQEMSEDVMRKHIDLYVNDYSIELGEKGKNAILTLMKAHPNFNEAIDKEQIFVAAEI